jgi:hypothetical protein
VAKAKVAEILGARASVNGMARAAPSHVHDALRSSSAAGYHAHHAARGVGHGGRGGAPPHGYDDRPRDTDRAPFLAGGKGAREGAPLGGRKGGSHTPSREARSRVACSHMVRCIFLASVHSSTPPTQLGTSCPIPLFSHPSRRSSAHCAEFAGAAPCSCRSTHPGSNHRRSSRGVIAGSESALRVLWVVCCLELLLIRKSAFPAAPVEDDGFTMVARARGGRR